MSRKQMYTWREIASDGCSYRKHGTDCSERLCEQLSVRILLECVRKTVIMLLVRPDINIKAKSNIIDLSCTVILSFVVHDKLTHRYVEALEYTFTVNCFIHLGTIHIISSYMYYEIIVILIMACSLTIRFILYHDTKGTIDCFMLTKRDKDKFKYFILQGVTKSSSRDFIFINCYNYRFKHFMLQCVMQSSNRHFIFSNCYNYYNYSFKYLVCIALLKARVIIAISIRNAIVINYIGVIKLYYASTEKMETRKALIYKGRIPGRVPLAHGAIAHQPDSTRKIDTIPDSAPTR